MRRKKSQPAFTCSKSKMETQNHCAKFYWVKICLYSIVNF